jgi:hypothetical protein
MISHVGDVAGPPSSAKRGSGHLLAAYDLNADKLYGHLKLRKDSSAFLAFCRYLRSLYSPEVRIAIVLDNFSPHLHSRRHRPPLTRGAELDDPPLHQLAQPTRSRQNPT